jgi:hypothetical protein
MTWALFSVAIVIAAVTATTGRASSDEALRRELTLVSGHSLFFGHQSVGANILDGLRDLAAQEGVAVQIGQVESGAGVKPGTWTHAYVGENTRPDLKIGDFERMLAGDARPEVAFLKLCYADVREDTDVRALLGQYQAALARLAAEHPETTFVHVTVPLTVVQRGPKAFVKRILGRAPGAFMENVRREEFNELLRGLAASRNEPLFDLARVESTTPQGVRQSHTWRSLTTPELVPAYASDGAHLNETGRRRAARELVRVLAAATRAR